MFIASTEFVETKRTRTKMGAFVETTLVANYFSGIESGSAPGRRLSSMAIEAAAAKILSLLGGSIVCVLDRERRSIGHGKGDSSRGVGTIEGLVRREEDGGRILELDCRSVLIAERLCGELARILVGHERLKLHVSVATDDRIGVAAGNLILMRTRRIMLRLRLQLL